MILPVGFSVTCGWREIPISDLVANIRWEQPTIKVFGREHLTPRLVAWYGDGAYSYAGQTHAPAAMPVWLGEAKREIETLSGALFNSVLLNYYRDGQDLVSWHADDEPELGAEPTIASWSLGAARTFAVKSKAMGGRVTMQLGKGDLLIMSGRSQSDFLHSVPKTAKPIGPRLNLTFRLVHCV